MSNRKFNILHALDDPNVFAPFFKGDSWNSWRAFLASLFALPMTPAQLELYQQCTGRSTPPSQPSNESWLICGRRSGKSRILATIAVFLACFRDWRPHLGPGERGVVMIVAQNKEQAQIIMRYCLYLLRNVPMLARQIASETRENISLRNNITIEIRAASFRSTRGFSIVAALLDELAMWGGDDSAEPDIEIINAIKPGMATIPNSMMLCASSPYARRGALWTAHRKHHGKDGDPILVWQAPTMTMNPRRGALWTAHRKHHGKDGDPILVWQAPTMTMNPRVPQAVIDEAVASDPANAAAEYYAEFRSDVEAFVSQKNVEACVSAGVHERSPVAGVSYAAFVDPSSGGGPETMTLATAHAEDGIVVIDCIRERHSPFSPESVVREFADLLKSYGVTQVQGDSYAGGFPPELFHKHGIAYEKAPKPKSDLYVHLLPVINSGLVDLLDDPRLVTQLCSLERKTARGGKDSIDHAPNTCDDLANVVAGVTAMLSTSADNYESYDWVFSENDIKQFNNPYYYYAQKQRRF